MRSSTVIRAGLAGAAFTALVVLPAMASAGTYYVAEDGSDSASGSAGSPWRTLQHAANQVGPGDTVEVSAGEYRGFDLRRSGTSSSPIRFRGGVGVVIDQDNPKTPDGVNIENASHVIVEGFTVRGASRAGFRAARCDEVTFRDNVADQNGRWGIFTAFCDDLLIEDNQTSRSGLEHGIYTSNSGDRPVIRNNRAWGNRRAGIHMNGDLSAGGDGLITGALVEGNVIYGNGSGGAAGINADGVQSSIIRNNLLYDNHATGIALFAMDGAAGSKNNKVENNTVLMPSDGRWCLQIRDGSTGTVVRNNILLNAHSFRGAIEAASDSLSGLSSNNNIGDRFSRDAGSSNLSLSQWQSATGQDGSSFSATTGDLFVSAGGHDYHLRSDSDAIDVGHAGITSSQDLDGNARVSGGVVDIGAYEYGAGSSWTPQQDEPQAEPAADGGSSSGSDGGSGGGTECVEGERLPPEQRTAENDWGQCTNGTFGDTSTSSSSSSSSDDGGEDALVVGERLPPEERTADNNWGFWWI